MDLEPVGLLPRAVPLAEMKEEKAFAGWELLRIGRLSVMPVPAPVWGRILGMAGRGRRA